MIEEFPKEREAKRKFLLDGVERIGPALQASGPKSEELGTLAPEAVQALRDAGMFRLKLPALVGGAEADPVTEMLVLEGLVRRVDHPDRNSVALAAGEKLVGVARRGDKH